jgi:hypothetical protein
MKRNRYVVAPMNGRHAIYDKVDKRVVEAFLPPYTRVICTENERIEWVANGISTNGALVQTTKDGRDARRTCRLLNEYVPRFIIDRGPHQLDLTAELDEAELFGGVQ